MAAIPLTYDQAWAAYRLPGEDEFHLIIGEWVQGVPQEEGFVVAPFDGHRGYIRTLEHSVGRPFQYVPDTACSQTSTDQEQYLRVAEEAILDLKSKKLEKVVVSKVKNVASEKVDIWQIYDRLLQLYPRAFVFCYHVPGQGLWCGATPEVLAKIQNEKVSTMALAGTQRHSGQHLEDVVWGEKEQEEQHIIELFVEEILEKENLAFSKSGPSTVKAGKMLHILSKYQFGYDDRIWQVIDGLHPGPAICGRPKESAKHWILKKEAHDREHYCGYIGPWSPDGTKELYINLRSMQVFEDALLLYLGGGLTAESVAAKEWEETELKATTMLAAIQKHVDNE